MNYVMIIYPTVQNQDNHVTFHFKLRFNITKDHFTSIMDSQTFIKTTEDTINQEILNSWLEHGKIKVA